MQIFQGVTEAKFCPKCYINSVVLGNRIRQLYFRVIEPFL